MTRKEETGQPVGLAFDRETVRTLRDRIAERIRSLIIDGGLTPETVSSNRTLPGAWASAGHRSVRPSFNWIPKASSVSSRAAVRSSASSPIPTQPRPIR